MFNTCTMSKFLTNFVQAYEEVVVIFGCGDHVFMVMKLRENMLLVVFAIKRKK